MFQPQPAPFATSYFPTLSYGIVPTHDLGFLFSTGGGGGGGAITGPTGALCPPYTSGSSSQQQQTSPSPAQLHGAHDMDQQPRRLDLDQGSSPNIKMEEQEPNPHSVAAQQAAARDYQPVLEGPLVGEKTSSNAITQEYAKAEDTYVQKTMALPQTYSHYRPIQGDGNCGWRAIGFSYYEKLIELGDRDRIEGEVARLMSLNHMLGRIGGYAYYEDFADEAIGLLRDLAPHATNPGMAQVILYRRWNDKSVEGSLIYYFRLLAATYLKANAARFESFLQDGQGIPLYCSQSIEIVNREIEQLGIVALTNILLKPIDFVLEIAYLDRSPGAQVNRYRFPEETNQQSPAELGPTIYLLYRPDHYDILYLAPPPPPLPISAPVAPVSLQVNRVDGFTSNLNITSTMGLAAFSTADLNILSMIPGGFGGGLSGLGSLGGLGSPASPGSTIGDAFSPVQQNSPWMPQFSDPLPVQAPAPPQPQPPVVAAQPATPSTPLASSPPNMATSASNIGSTHAPAAVVPSQPLAASAGYPIRFTHVQYMIHDNSQDDVRHGFLEPTFNVQTSTFKNSIWNRAHFGNPDFHPEEWSPDDDFETRKGKSKKGY
ncbi:Ubiquitin thioesterase OTUB1 [Cladobotryum mycophilum]|uniref:ubiquitinyl hydrolase 1 n=1 Tax=Cladobotryum mycophilum TaxID=491253 RepID=A0ABR0S815_9HYPO